MLFGEQSLLGYSFRKDLLNTYDIYQSFI